MQNPLLPILQRQQDPLGPSPLRGSQGAWRWLVLDLTMAAMRHQILVKVQPDPPRLRFGSGVRPVCSAVASSQRVRPKANYGQGRGGACACALLCPLFIP